MINYYIITNMYTSNLAKYYRTSTCRCVQTDSLSLKKGNRWKERKVEKRERRERKERWDPRGGGWREWEKEKPYSSPSSQLGTEPPSFRTTHTTSCSYTHLGVLVCRLQQQIRWPSFSLDPSLPLLLLLGLLGHTAGAQVGSICHYHIQNNAANNFKSTKALEKLSSQQTIGGSSRRLSAIFVVVQRACEIRILSAHLDIFRKRLRILCIDRIF